MAEHRVGIIGMGHKLPAKIRTNDDPVFDWVRKHHPPGDNLFFGYKQRHVLADGENAVDILVPAARMALDDAGLAGAQIDHLIGCVSPNTYIVPADLFDLARRLELPEATLTIPLANDFSNFNVAVVLADSLVRAGRAHNVLVAIAGGWTRAVSETTPEVISAGDAAAAVVIGRERPGCSARWTVVDSEVITREMYFGEMALFAKQRNTGATDPKNEQFTGPYFQITEKGLGHFTTFGGKTATEAVLRVLQRQNIALADVTVTGHQASQGLLDLWKQELAPALQFDTIANVGNVTVANIPVNLCLMEELVSTPYVVALALAPDMHAHALLLCRAA